MTKLYENTFRAVNIAFANEMAGREPALRPRPDRGHRGRGDQAVRVHDVLSGPRASVGTASHATRTTCFGGCESGAGDAPVTRAGDEGDRDAADVRWWPARLELLEHAGIDVALRPACWSSAPRTSLGSATRVSPRPCGSCASCAGEGVDGRLPRPARAIARGWASGWRDAVGRRSRALGLRPRARRHAHDGSDYGWLDEFDGCSTAPTARRSDAHEGTDLVTATTVAGAAPRAPAADPLVQLRPARECARSTWR